MAIQVGGTTVIDNNRNLINIASGLGGVDTGTSLPSTSGRSNGDLFLDTTGDGTFYIFNDGVWNIVKVTAAAKPNTVSGYRTYVQPGTFTWTVPSGVNHVSVLAIGGGGSATGYGSGAGGGGLGWMNQYVVSAGEIYTISIGSLSGSNQNRDGVDTVFSLGGVPILTAFGGKHNPAMNSATGFEGGGYQVKSDVVLYHGGGQGGDGGSSMGSNYVAGGGGGAGGYTGNGGNGAGQNSNNTSNAGQNGSGGGGGGGGGIRQSGGYSAGGNGGGTGIYGAGSNGVGRPFNVTSSTTSVQTGGTGGSGGASGGSSSWSGPKTTGGSFGGGGGNYSGGGNTGACRIIWKTGTVGSYGYPSTGVGP